MFLPVLISVLSIVTAYLSDAGSWRRFGYSVLAIAIFAAAPVAAYVQEIRHESARLKRHANVSPISVLEAKLGRFRFGTDLSGGTIDQQYDRVLRYAEAHGLKTESLVDHLDMLRTERLRSSAALVVPSE